MEERFEVVFLDEATNFIKNIDKKASKKILFNIRKSKHLNDPKIFKKLNEDIWEYRTLYNKKQYRLLAFWDKSESKQTLVVATHGFVKKQSKVSKREIDKAFKIMDNYFKNKGK